MVEIYAARTTRWAPRDYSACLPAFDKKVHDRNHHKIFISGEKMWEIDAA